MNPRYRRAEVRMRLVEIGNALGPLDLGIPGLTAATVQASYGWTGDIEADVSLRMRGDTTGISERRALGTGAPTNDVYDIEFELKVFGAPSPFDADRAAERALSALAVKLRDSQRLVLAGVPSTMANSEFDASVSVADFDTDHGDDQNDGDMFNGTITGRFTCTSTLK